MKISTLILVTLILGIVFGIFLIYGFPNSIPFLDYYFLSPLGEAFLRLIQFVVVPIVFFSLILGLTRIQNAAQIDWLVSLIPVNPLESLSTGNLLQTIFSAALIGVCIQFIGDRSTSFIALGESVYFIFEKILSLILYVAPIGVFALISSAKF